VGAVVLAFFVHFADVETEADPPAAGQGVPAATSRSCCSC
jgi:hypothetical protein